MLFRATLYCTYVGPHIEFAISAWNPFLKKDVVTLEKVQRRATRMPTSLKGLDYEERLNRMNLMSLELRRVRGDLIQMYKVTKCTDLITWHSTPVWSEPRGGRRSQLRREIVSACQPRHNFFLNRIAPVWNSLPDEIVDATSIESFKSKLDKFLTS